MTKLPVPKKLAKWNRPKTRMPSILLALALLLVACAPDGSPAIPSENVLFESNVGAEFTGFTISFQHPRELQVGYFSDSGAYGWMLSDADPQEVFWSANQTGEEISFILMLSQENDEFSGYTPAQLLQEQFSWEGDVETFTENDKQVAYYFQDGEAKAAIVTPKVFLILFGSYPAAKEALARKSFDTLLHSVSFHDAAGRDFSSETVWGTRREGALAAGSSNKGYIPLASASAWEFSHTGGDLTLSIETSTPDTEITLDILGEDGKSALAEGAIQFTGALKKRTISLPSKGDYTIQILSPSGWYGWYTIQIQ